MTRDEHVYIDRMLGVLVDLFGRQAIEQSLERISPHRNGTRSKSRSRKKIKPRDMQGASKDTQPTARDIQRSVHEHDPEVKSFIEGLERGVLLPEAEDVRQFATIVGIKHLEGRSRRDLLKGLLRAMDAMPLERVSRVLREAPHVTASIRREGFAVLTDKLLENIVRDHDDEIGNESEQSPVRFLPGTRRYR